MIQFFCETHNNNHIVILNFTIEWCESPLLCTKYDHDIVTTKNHFKKIDYCVLVNNNDLDNRLK